MVRGLIAITISSAYPSNGLCSLGTLHSRIVGVVDLTWNKMSVKMTEVVSIGTHHGLIFMSVSKEQCSDDVR